jgi:filamentous hemagglutinin
VLAAPNGVPLVNITTPSAAGVSRNTWRQFDVGAPGAILNNSRTDTPTQLGGWVQGNPWLAAGSARVILNEVNSAHPSHLNGWVEVAGQRAEVVIANPAGIQVNGAGFINASAVTLTTGAPVFHAGELDAYRVQGGQVTIEGGGLDTRGAEATAILARAVQVNAGLWAHRLQVVTGTHTVAASDHTVAARDHTVAAAATPTGDTPAFALDVAQIGGMYAGHIHLVGTEVGLGVNNRGLIAADAGQLSLAVNGQLTNHGALLAAQDMDLRADRVLNEGTAGLPAVIGAGGTLGVQAQHVTNRGTLQASSLLTRADTLDNRTGGALIADRIAIEAQEINNRPDTHRPDTNAARAQAAAPVIAARQSLQLGVQTLRNEDGALLHSEGDIGIGGSLDADGNAIGEAQTVSNLSATIEAMGDITLAARALNNERRNVHVTQTTVVDQTAQLSMPAWWVNGKNEHNAPIANTSNHTPYQYYLLDPASILSEALLITPDGNRIHRVEVALDPSDSIHYAASGAYGGQYGVQSRITLGAPTTAVLYVQARHDGVANPDQVPGSADVFAGQTSEVHTWQQDALSYSSAYGRCSTNCTLLVVQPGYNNPLTDLLRSDHTNLTPTHPGLEVSRTARHTALEDRLNNDAGAPAAIRAGTAMRLQIGESLINRHAELLAGGALDIQAAGAMVSNEGHTLKRTHHFAITSHTAGLGDFDWTKPDITEVLGELGGRITSGASLSVQALDLNNTDHARASGLASNGLSFAGLSLPGAGAPLVISPSSLFQPAPPNRNVLIETDPRFTQHRAWLGSDYLLDRLAHDPSATLKRLGDGFHEQKLVREQVAELTGRRFLPGHGNDEAQFMALMDAGIAHAQALELKPGIALSAEQVAQLTTDLVWLVEREVVLPDGQRTTALVPQVYLRAVPGGELLPSGALIAGEAVRLDLERDLANTGGRIEGGVLLAQAGRDISNIGGLLQARSDLLASAGRHVTIASPIHTTTFTGAHAQQTRTELAGVGTIRVTGVTGDVPAARLTIKAGEDVVLQGADVGSAGAGGSTAIEAGRNVQLQTVSVGSANSVVAHARNWRRNHSQQEIGTDIAAQGDIRIHAGNDVAARAASVQAGGDLSVLAGQDITLQAGRARSHSESSLYLKRSGPLSKKSTEERESRSADEAIGSSFGGAHVAMQAGRDVLVQGSSVIGDQGLTLQAGRDVAIEADQHHHSQRHLREVRKSGAFTSGASVTLGKQQRSTEQRHQQTLAAASTVGAVRGDVSITAGSHYRQSGSDVLAPEGDVQIAARDVAITETRESSHSSVQQRFKQSGVSAGISSPVIDAVQGALSTARAVGNTDDARMKALGAATTALQARQAHQALQGAPAGAAGFTLNLSLGASRSESNTHAQTDSARGSAVAAAGDVRITARGAGRESSLLVQGSDVRAGHSAHLSAEGNVSLQAAQEHHRETSRQDGKSASLGVSIGASGMSANASASRSKGAGQGNETIQRNTHVNAGQLIVLGSGGDTTLKGAVASAERIEATVGGNLRINSLQDTASHHERSQSSGAGVSVPVAGGQFGASVSAGKTEMASTYASVAEQSGLRAGDGGFDVQVQGQTALVGGAITSTNHAVEENRNRFESAGGLELSDVHNRAAYEARGSSAAVGTGSQLGDSGVGIGADQGSSASTTHAAISGIAGKANARTGDAETGIAPIFDKERIRDEIDAQVHITKAFGQQAVPIAARYADDKAVELRRQGNEEEARQWDEGGVYRAALHAGIGLLTGGLAGAAGAGTGALLIDDLGEGIATLNLPEPVRQGLTQVAGAVLGAATGGSAGAAASLNQTAHNHLSRSPYARVRRTVSQENARLTQACGTTCSAEDFRRIDQQMARLEAAGNLAEIARHSGLTPQQGQQLAQLALELAPVYGSGESLVQLVSGKSSVTGEEVSRFWAAVGVVPVAGGVLRRVGEPAVDALVAIFRGGETSKALADASDVARAPSAAQGDQLLTELGSLSQYAVDHSRDAEYLARTDRNLLQQHNFDMDHVLAGEINAAGKATGYHAEFAADGAARIKPGATVTHNANGTYEAPVQVFDAGKGIWVDKKNISTFFPPSWSHARIEYEITEAFKQGTPGTSFIKTSPGGMRIQFHWDAKNKRTTYHPLGDQ